MATHVRLGSLGTANTRNSVSRPSTAPSAAPSSQSPITTVHKHGVLHHAFPRTLAPYPVSHDNRVIDADSLDLAFRMELSGGNPSTSITEYQLDNPKTHPRRCLDIGCGSGSWTVLSCQKWNTTTFVGFDLVCSNVALDLLDVKGASTKAASDSIAGNIRSRVEWVQGNFLKPLPFADGEFDYIHVSGIARGVPEDRWDGLLAEISRVLAVNGYIEMIEEDVIFPILPSEPEPPVTPTSNSSFNDSTSAIAGTKRGTRNSVSIPLFRDDEGSTSRHMSTSLNRFLAAEAPKPPPVPSLKLNTKFGQRDVRRLSSDQSPTKLFNGVGGILVGNPCSPRAVPVRRGHDPAIPFGWDGPPEPNPVKDTEAQSRLSHTKAARRPHTASSIASSIKSITKSAPGPSLRSPVFSSINTTKKASPHLNDPTPVVPPLLSHLSSIPSPMYRYVQPKTTFGGVEDGLRSSIKHDHQLLQTLFYGVYERRFINTTPTAILPSLLSMYFQNVSVTPPIDFPNPPPPDATRETCRRKRRNAIQRECGSGGLEYSQGLSMNISRPSMERRGSDLQNGANTLAQMMFSSGPRPSTASYRAYDFGPSDRDSTSRINQLRKARSSPGISSLTSSSSSSRDSSPSLSGSALTQPSVSPSSGDTSSLTTPVSGIHPFGSGSKGCDSGLREDHGMDEFGLSPDGDRLSSRTSPGEMKGDEEEDARYAIMGDGGFFPTNKTEGEMRTLSDYPSLSSFRSSSDATEPPSAWYEDDDDILEMVTRRAAGVPIQEIDELGVYEGILEPEEPEDPIDSITWDQRDKGRQRVYVRPRPTFTGHGMPIPGNLLELDDLSMGIHLTRAWINVVACKEAMWDELQRRAKIEPPPSYNNGITNGPKIQSVRRTTLLDEIEWSGSENSISDREKFELLFHRFEDDMRHWAAVGSAIPTWNHEPVTPIGPSVKSKITSMNNLHVQYPLDDGRGPGRNGLIIPGLDICRTMRVLTARKTVEGSSLNRKPAKITGIF